LLFDCILVVALVRVGVAAGVGGLVRFTLITIIIIKDVVATAKCAPERIHVKSLS